MKEISYEGPVFEDEEAKWKAKNTRSVGSTKAPTVRTFRADVEGLIQEKGTTKTQIVMAEAARREARGESRILHEDNETHLGRTIFLLALVLAFSVGVGIYALVGTKLALPFSDAATTTPPAPTPTPEELGIVISDSPREQILADLSISFGKTSLPAGGKRPIVFYMKDANGTARPGTVTEFLHAILPPLSNHTLAASVDPELTYMIYSRSTLAGVISIRTRSYANSFATMLDWESTLASDLIPVLNAWYDRKYIKELIARPFVDERLEETDIRVLYDTTAKPVLAYGFFNKKTLIIAGNKEALTSAFKERAEVK